MNHKNRSWIKRLFRKNKSGSKSNLFRKSKKSDGKSKPLWMHDPSTLPANVANRNLNPELDDINYSDTKNSVTQEDIHYPTTDNLSEKTERSKMSKEGLSGKRKSGSKFNWFKKTGKSNVSRKPFWMLDPASLPANVANRNLNPESEGSDSPKTRTSGQQDTQSRRTVKHSDDRRSSRIRKKKLRLPFKDIKIGFSEFNIWISIYSLGLFILAYLFINFIYQFATILTASFFNIDAVLYYYEVYFPIGNASNLWSAANIIAITVAGPLVSALVSVLFFRILRYRKSLSPWLSVFLYWAALHAAAHFLGAFVGGVVTQEGMGYVINWLYMNVFFKILFSLTFLFLLSLIGYYAKSIPRINYISELPRSEKRLSNSLSIDIIPWFVGTLLLLLFKIPDKIPQHELIRVYDSIILASMLFAIAAKAFSNKRPRISQRFRFATIKNQDGLGILAIALIMLVFMRYVLIDGIHFIINISFSAGFYR